MTPENGTLLIWVRRAGAELLSIGDFGNFLGPFLGRIEALEPNRIDS